jgi:cytochrome c-type biogenesis protein CcmE
MSQTVPHYPDPTAQEEAVIFTNRRKILIGLVVLVVALGYFAFMAFESATVYYYTVGEMRQQSPTAEGKMVRVSGKLVPSSFSREAGATLARFELTDGSETLHAAHDGVLPDLFFNEHSEIILEGAFMPDGRFESRNVIVKCPSKYVAVEQSG